MMLLLIFWRNGVDSNFWTAVGFIIFNIISSVIVVVVAHYCTDDAIFLYLLFRFVYLFLDNTEQKIIYIYVVGKFNIIFSLFVMNRLHANRTIVSIDVITLWYGVIRYVFVVCYLFMLLQFREDDSNYDDRNKDERRG